MGKILGKYGKIWENMGKLKESGEKLGLKDFYICREVNA